MAEICRGDDEAPRTPSLDPQAIYRYLVGGLPLRTTIGPPVDAPHRSFSGSVENLRDALRGRPEPFGLRGEPLPDEYALSHMTRPALRQRRRTASGPDAVLSLLDAEFAAHYRDASIPAAGSRPADVPPDQWFRHYGETIWAIFESGLFGSRTYLNQLSVLRSFHAYRNGRGGADRWVFWRLLNLELWTRECIDADPHDPDHAAQPLVAAPGPEYDTDGDGRHRQAPAKTDYEPNRYKTVVTRDGRWARFPLRVDLVSPGDDVAALAARRAAEFFSGLRSAPVGTSKQASGRPWFLFVGEKIVAVAQHRFVYVRDIRPGIAARTLARLVGATPFGIGVSQPVTMQVAIDEVGLPRIIIAAAAGAAGKILGRRGWFYRITGTAVSSIDGPAPYCAYPANVSAKLAPRDPDGVAREVSAAVRESLPRALVAGFGGTVIIDANDIGQTILGHDTRHRPDELASAYVDNPTGQGREQTPISVVLAQLDSFREPFEPAEYGV